MTSWYKAMVVSVALLSLGGLSACGDDDAEPMDAGTDARTIDTGTPDTGPDFDAGCTPMCEGRECGDDGCGGFCGTAGDGTCPGGLACNEGTCPDTVFTRIAHLIPNAPNVDLCVYVTAGGSVLSTVGPLLESAGAATGMPFRGVSSYVGLVEATAGVEYVVKVYAETDVADADSCPAIDATDPVPLVEQTIAGADLTVGAYNTIAAVGFLDEGGTDPSYCGVPGTFGMPCSAENQQPHLEIYADDVTLDDDTQTGIRFLHAVPNLGSIDVCWDPDGEAGAMEPVELIANTTFPDASAYLETAEMTTGHISLHMDIAGVTDALTCHNAGGQTQIATIPLPWPYPAGMMPPGSVNDFAAGQIATIFFSGNAATPTMPATAVSAIPWEDAPVTP